MPILETLPDPALFASSELGPAFQAKNSRLNSKPIDGSSGSWSPSSNDQMQYLQIEFPKALPIYGIIIRGSPLLDQYVTSFKVLHSFDGMAFHYVVNKDGNPQIFSGSYDSRTPVKSMFKTPIETKFIRVYPVTWHESIAVRLEVLGCQRDVFLLPEVPIFKVTTTTTTTPKPIVPITEIPVLLMPPTTISPVTIVTVDTAIPMCDEPMGVENGQLHPNQIKFSSSKDDGKKKSPLATIKLSSGKGWMPLVDSQNEYILVSRFSTKKFVL